MKMKMNAISSMILCLVFSLALGLTAEPGPARGGSEDTSAILKEANKELRRAQRDMFSGKTDNAVASLEKIREMILKLKASAPDDTGIKTAENKYSKLVKDLERRTGRDLGGGTLSAAESSSATTLPEKPPSPVGSGDKETAQTQAPPAAAEAEKAPAKVPFAARRPLSATVRSLNSLERNLADLADPDYRGDKDQLVERIEKKLLEIKASLDEARSAAAEKGVSSHPDFIDAESRLSAATNQVARARGEYEESQAAAAKTAAEVTAAVEALREEYDRVKPFFQGATGTVIYYNDLEPVEELIKRIEEFEKDQLAGARRKLEAFAGKYGSSAEEIDRKAGSMGYSGQDRASYPYTKLAEGIENIHATRTVMAEDLVRKLKERMERVKSGHDFFVVEQYGDIKKWVEMAARYDAENPAVKSTQSEIDAEIERGMKEFHARIDRRQWPAHASNAPENAEALARAAREWFENSPDWGRREKDPRRPLTVTVTGPWSVQETNILGEPIMYGLPVLLAVEVESDRELNVARVYSLTLRTVEKRGVKMEPPFDHATVGNSYFIRPSEVE